MNQQFIISQLPKLFVNSLLKPTLKESKSTDKFQFNVKYDNIEIKWPTNNLFAIYNNQYYHNLIRVEANDLNS